jgi:hypothetical protein
MFNPKRKHAFKDTKYSKKVKLTYRVNDMYDDDDYEMYGLDAFERIENKEYGLADQSRFYWSVVEGNITLARHFFKTCDCINNLDRTILIRAVENNVSLEMIELVLENMPELINEFIDNGKTAIMCCKSVEMCRLLFSYGADIKNHSFSNFDNFCKTSALHEVNDSKVCKWMLDNGADTKIKNHNDQTPLSYAISHHKSKDICNLLMNGSNIQNGKITLPQKLDLTDDYENDICSLLLSHNISKILIK